MKIVVYGLTITSSWGNGHATTYRSLIRALAERGHAVKFVEKDVEWYSSTRDMPQPSFCSVHFYSSFQEDWREVVAAASDADVIVVGSYFPDAIVLTERLLNLDSAPILFYDIDTPITLAALHKQGGAEYLDAGLVPRYSAYLSFTGGPALAELEQRFGSPCAVPLYCSVDARLYCPTLPGRQFRCELSYLGTYAADRQVKLDHLLNKTAALMPACSFLVAGAQYPNTAKWEQNVKRIDHVAPADHPAFYSSCRFTLNLTRAEMVSAGYSPSVRLFEASACGAAILSDRWSGLEQFLTPGEEVLTPTDAYEVASILTEMSDDERARIGSRARQRVLAEHTSAHRAEEFERIVEAVTSKSSRKVRTHNEGVSAMSSS